MVKNTALSPDFWAQLKEKYLAPEGPGADSWSAEETSLREMVPLVAETIAVRYTGLEPLGTGGTAIILKAHDDNMGIPVAVKLSRPVAGRESLFSQIISKEISRLRESNHPNIIQIFMHGSVAWSGQTWPYYIMEFVKGGKDAQKLAALGNDHTGRPLSGNVIVSWIRQIAEGLAYLHHKGTIHGDVKLENTLIAPDGRVRISDLGSARLLTDEDHQTVFTFTRPWAHPELRAIAAAATDENRVRIPIERRKLKTAFDMFALGKNIFRLLRRFDVSDDKSINAYVRAYLELAASRLLDGNPDESECSLGLPRRALAEIKYTAIDQFVLDMRKLTGEYALHTAIPELDHHFARTIQVVSPGPSPFSERLASLLAEPLVRRLGNMSQLGLMTQVYPGATHTRLEHVLGTFAHAARYVDALWNDPINPLFRQIMNEKDVNALLLAALCHDIGQYPLAHDLAEVEPDFFGHQNLGKKVLQGELKHASIASLLAKIKGEWHIEPTEIVKILSVNPADYSQPIKTRILHTILDGPIDADKVDYILRDSNSLGVPYGNAVDVERFLRCLTVTFAPQVEGELLASVGIHEKGKVPAEAIAFARYALFGTVYWHHTSRAMKAMLHMATRRALPKAEKRSKEYSEFRHEFEDFVFGERKFVRQQSLFGADDDNSLHGATYLHPEDFRLLQWIYSKTDDKGAELLRMLCSRDLFKRLLVISGLKNQALWKSMTRLDRDFSAQEKIAFQQEVQLKLVNKICSLDPGVRTATALSTDKTDSLAGRNATGEILFLVDIPSDRKASELDLYFLPEKRIRDTTTLLSERARVEDSLLWAGISESFQPSVGKVRVFVHPDFDKTATLALTRADIEGALESAYRLILSKPKE